MEPFSALLDICAVNSPVLKCTSLGFDDKYNCSDISSVHVVGSHILMAQFVFPLYLTGFVKRVFTEDKNVVSQVVFGRQLPSCTC